MSPPNQKIDDKDHFTKKSSIEKERGGVTWSAS